MYAVLEVWILYLSWVCACLCRAFDVELIYIAQCLKMPIVEVAVNWKEIDGSKIVPLWSGLQMGKDLLLVRLRYMFRIWTMSSMTKKDE